MIKNEMLVFGNNRVTLSQKDDRWLASRKFYDNEPVLIRFSQIAFISPGSYEDSCQIILRSGQEFLIQENYDKVMNLVFE